MKNKLQILSAVFVIALMLNTPAHATGWERIDKIQKGYNLAGWLEAGWLGANYPDPNAYTVDNMQLFAQLGFQTVRVPVLYEWIIDENPPYNQVVGQAPFDLIDSKVIPVADECDMTVILVNHHGKALTDANFEAEIPRICGQWKFLTQLYADLPHDRYFFELRNEPTYEISNENLRTVQQAIIDTIRTYDTERTLIVGANWWNAPWSLVQTMPYDDDNIIYTFHSYAPFDFTHQGMSWHYPYIPPGITFSADTAEADDLRNSLIEVKSWSDAYNVPIYWGEFGVSWFADAESRCNYIDFTIEVADELSIPWIYWDIKNSHDAFGIFENGTIHQNNLIPCFADAMQLEYRVACNIALPLDFVDFEGKEEDCTIRLNWTTERENQVDYFDIQRSTNAYNFKSIGRIAAVGDTPERTDYTFTDKTFGEQNYYRLKAVNLNGSYKYFDIIHVKSSCHEEDVVEIYPNPVRATQLVNIRLRAEASAKATIEVVNIFGQVVRQAEHHLYKGINIITYPTDHLPSGNYFIRFAGQHWLPETQKFIITH